MVNDNDVVFLWPDADAVHTKKYTGDLSMLHSVNFQVELMSTCIVLIHGISVSFFNTVYVIEPYTSVALLEYIKPALAKNPVTVQSVCGKYLPLRVQEFFDSPKPTTFDDAYFDGFIITQDTMLIKWKQPTVDARYVGDGVFQIGHRSNMVDFRLDDGEDAAGKCEVDSIYELSTDCYAVHIESMKFL